ncbi:alpha/beta hydrolase [Haliea sp.]
MASTRSKLLNCVTRLSMRLLLRREVSVPQFRQLIARLDRRRAGRLAYGVSVEEQVSPIAGRWIHNRNCSPGKVILYLHGGAFIVRMPEMHSGMVSRLCAQIGASAFMPWYRLAPEHPFPAAPQDALAAYRYLLRNYRSDDILVMGDSAGGTLTLALLNLIKAEGLPNPAAAVALSPPVDFAQVSATWLMHRWTEPMYALQPAVAPQRHYLNFDHYTDPVASPVYGDLYGLPPVLLVVGGVEALRDDALGYARVASVASAPVTLHIWQGMPHVHMLHDFLPEAALAEQEVVKWVHHALRNPEEPSDKGSLKDAVILFNRQPVIGRVTRFSNSDATYMGGVA